MKKPFFVQWLEHSVISHKESNLDEVNYINLDNHGSRFSTDTVDLCIENNLEMLCYPGHLTHILQGPEVVLNKPL